MQRDKHLGEDERTIICLAVNPVKYFVKEQRILNLTIHIILQRKAYKLEKNFINELLFEKDNNYSVKYLKI